MNRLSTTILLAGVVGLAAAGRADAQMTPLRPTPPTEAGGPAEGAGADAAKPQTATSPSGGDKTAATSPQPSAKSAAAEDAGGNQVAAGPIKSGRWQFTARLLAPNSQQPVDRQSVSSGSPEKGGGITTSYADCITADRAVPIVFGQTCKLDMQSGAGSAINWSVTCADTHVHAEGIAHYRGDTMDATATSQLSGDGGKPTTMTQYITGRYLGACAATTAALPPAPKTEPTGSTNKTQTEAAPPPATNAAPTDIPTREEAIAAVRGETPVSRETHRHYARHAYRRYHGTAGYGGSYDRGAGFGGPGPNAIGVYNGDQ